MQCQDASSRSGIERSKLIPLAESSRTVSHDTDQRVDTELIAQIESATSVSCREVTIPLLVDLGSTKLASVVPVTTGLPCPRGAIREPVTATATVRGPMVESLPVQIEPLVRWPDGSVQWMRADFLVPPGCDDTTNWSLEVASCDRTDHFESTLRLHHDANVRNVTTGTHRFTIPHDELRPFSAVTAGDATDAVRDMSYASELVLVDRRGRRHQPKLVHWRVESVGPVRLTMAAEGQFPGVRGLRLRLRESFYVGTGLVRLEVTLHNSRRARHRGGQWDLGDPGSVLFEELALQIMLPGGPLRTIAWSTDPRADCEQVNGVDFSLYQDSSGGEQWESPNHINRNGRIACRFRGYRLLVENRQSTGERALPTISVASDTMSVTAAFPEFWQQFPKAIAVEEDQLRIGLFPRECDDLFELQGGERKTHVFWLRFGDAESDDTAANCRSLAWAHHPICVRPTREWCDATGALPELSLPAFRSRESLDRLLGEACHGPGSLVAHRERVDEYGWRNYGDVFADHEQLHYRGPKPLVSHYNNQFDMVHGLLIHYLRTGDRHWWKWGDALARHVVDIDIYHTVEDKAAYNGGLFWFTDHYLHAHASTHRTYSRFNRRSWRQSYGGGPSPEHNFTSGLMLHYCLTGNRDSRDAVISLADWVIAMDDGRRNLLGLVDGGPTGRASGPDTPVKASGRAAGNSINALLDAWTLTAEPKYLDFAEALIRRCIHPGDDVGALDLLNVEENWSYTVFLKSLSTYLDRKAEAGQFDRMFEYAQASLVHYAQWMLEHERPYFDQVEKLEFPTETWAAQEFRKANVLRLAAPHVEEPLRTRLFDRGDQLADRAWHDLFRFVTRATARALAIVMIEGHLDCTLRSREIDPTPTVAPGGNFGEPVPFIPQRRRVKLAATRPAGMFGIVGRLLNLNRWLRYLRNGAGNPNGPD